MPSASHAIPRRVVFCAATGTRVATPHPAREAIGAPISCNTGPWSRMRCGLRIASRRASNCRHCAKHAWGHLRLAVLF